MKINEMIEIIKSENPTLRKGSDEYGYIEITGNEYNAIIEEWAKNRFNKQNEEIKKTSAKADLLAKLGITEDEAKLLLS